MKKKKKKRKYRKMMKKTMVGTMVVIVLLPLFSGLVPKQQTTAMDPKLAQAYLESMSQDAENALEPEIDGRYEVIDVQDDCTLKIDYKGKEEAVKLIGIESAAHENKKHLQQLLSDSFVDLEFDTVQRDQDGNLLAYVYLEDGRFLNEELLLSGHALLNEETENIRYEEQLYEAQADAKEHSAGVWETMEADASETEKQ